jgi:hypothetical protein
VGIQAGQAINQLKGTSSARQQGTAVVEPKNEKKKKRQLSNRFRPVRQPSLSGRALLFPLQTSLPPAAELRHHELMLRYLAPYFARDRHRRATKLLDAHVRTVLARGDCPGSPVALYLGAGVGRITMVDVTVSCHQPSSDCHGAKIGEFKRCRWCREAVAP